MNTAGKRTQVDSLLDGMLSHVEITGPLGRRDLVPVEAYVQLTADDLVGTRVQALSRRDVIARLALARRS